MKLFPFLCILGEVEIILRFLTTTKKVKHLKILVLITNGVIELLQTFKIGFMNVIYFISFLRYLSDLMDKSNLSGVFR